MILPVLVRRISTRGFDEKNRQGKRSCHSWGVSEEEKEFSLNGGPCDEMCGCLLGGGSKEEK